MYNRLDTIPACDGQTDERTSCHGIVRAVHARKNRYICLQLFDWSTKARKVAVVAAKTMLNAKTVLEVTAAGLDAP